MTDSRTAAPFHALRELEHDFWRAPSAHNTQPWVLRYGPDGVEIGWDPERALPVSDPTGRDLRLGLGAFVECCLIVCADAGIAVDFEPGHRERDLRVGRLVASAAPYATPFSAEDVRRRGSSRVPYEPGRLPEPVVEELLQEAEQESGGAVRLLPCRDLTRLLRAADRHQFGTPEVVTELREWMRLTPSHPRYRLDGLTDRALALGRTEALGLRAALSPAAYGVLRHLGLPYLLAAASGGLLDYDGDVLVLVAPPGCDADGQVAMGRVLLRQMLHLARHGLSTHPLSQIIDAPATRDGLAALLGVDAPDRLLHVARAGRPIGPAARSARIV
ncbi:hypothetical protein [Microtetraspora glauca]|uniref:Nitroreductase n=1 Tax=Microtetraspora glauca TaxID=1996 RepID=A0ABV3GRE4_MICGL